MTTHHESASQDTVTFTGYAYDVSSGFTLFFTLASNNKSYQISQGNGLDLELPSRSSTLTLTFQYASSGWPVAATVSVALYVSGSPSGDPQGPTCTFSNAGTTSEFEIAVNTGSGQIVFDPKIRVIPPG